MSLFSSVKRVRDQFGLMFEEVLSCSILRKLIFFIYYLQCTVGVEYNRESEVFIYDL